jgi:hypothetical protein
MRIFHSTGTVIAMQFRLLNRVTTVLTLAGLLAIASPMAATAQCPMCRLNVKNSMASGVGGKGFGLNKGITYLLVTPYMLIAGVGGATLYYYRRKRRHYRPAL